MKIFSKEQIQQTLSDKAVIQCVEEGFVLYSKGEAVIPPIASLHFENPPGDCHIKYGYAKKGGYYVVKIASGFQDNPKRGLPSGNGLILLFDKKTGTPVCLFQDEGYLTDLRTAAAGCIAAKYLAPKKITYIGIVGTGAQAFYQLKFLAHVTDCPRVLVWGRDIAKAKALCHHPELKEFQFQIAADLDQLCAICNLIVTTTSSTKPLLFAAQIRPGTHITGVGADDLGKQELDPRVFDKADRIVVDSRSQCASIGDVSHASIDPKRIFELGEVISDLTLQRKSEDEITIADLTGVAIQDLQIAIAAYEALT